jgi:hypothetical protein
LQDYHLKQPSTKKITPMGLKSSMTESVLKLNTPMAAAVVTPLM